MFTPQGLQAAGSDGNCIVTARGDTQSVGNISLLIPASSLAKLARITDNDVEFHVGTTDKSIVFFKENFLFSARLMEGSYINTNQLLTAIRNGFYRADGYSGFEERALLCSVCRRGGKGVAVL